MYKHSHTTLNSLPIHTFRIILHNNPLLTPRRHSIHIRLSAHLCAAARHNRRLIVRDRISLGLDDAAAQRLKWERCASHFGGFLGTRRVGAAVCGREDAGKDLGHEGLAGGEAAADDAETCFDADDGVEGCAVPWFALGFVGGSWWED